MSRLEAGPVFYWNGRHMVSGPFAPPQAEIHPKTRPPWIPLVWFGILLLTCYAPILRRLVLNWSSDQDMGHGFFVPLVAGYIAWQRREKLAAIPRRPSLWGLALVICAAALALAGTIGAELFTARIAFVLSLTGILLYLGGKARVKELAFPLLLLLFMIPIPQIIYARLTMHLQFLASGMAETLISLAGIPVIRSGNILELPHETLNIVEACSGIRSLISLSFLALVYAYFADKRVWMRWALLIATVPIAIAANAARVALTGMLSQFDTDLAKGFYHEIEGYLVFIVALICLLAVHRGLSAAMRRRGHALGNSR